MHQNTGAMSNLNWAQHELRITVYIYNMSHKNEELFESENYRIRSLIEETFEKNVRGVVPDLAGFNSKHDGAEGDWLTKKMGLTVNGKNEPDFMGFEMKKHSKNKTTFGDWSPNEALFLGRQKSMDREKFLEVFGSPNIAKGGRFSWSGQVFPKVGNYNSYGQILTVDKVNNIFAIYDHRKNEVESSRAHIPQIFRTGEVTLAKWRHDSLRKKVETKFNQRGWFRCLKNDHGAYDRIQFGGPINFENFMRLFSNGTIYIDCGMHQVNTRPYMTFRASNRLWDQLAE